MASSSAAVARGSGQLCLGAAGRPPDDSRPHAAAPSSEEVAYDAQAERGALWYLVWCHERSYKEEAQGLRETLDQMARDAGGRFFCVKKARVYNAWRTGRRSPHLLLTDWREIKPCMQAMASADPSDSARYRPLLIAVLAEEQKTFQRVREWSRTVRAAGCDGKVDVIRSVDEMCALLAQVLPEVGRARQRAGSSDEGPGQGQEAADARGAPFVSSVEARGLPPSVVGVLSPICVWQSAAAVEKILRLAAMDQLYED